MAEENNKQVHGAFRRGLKEMIEVFDVNTASFQLLNNEFQMGFSQLCRELSRLINDWKTWSWEGRSSTAEGTCENTVATHVGNSAESW